MKPSEREQSLIDDIIRAARAGASDDELKGLLMLLCQSARIDGHLESLRKTINGSNVK